MSRRTVTRPSRLDLADRRFVEGTEELRRQAREEAAEQIRLYQQHDLAMKSSLPEFVTLSARVQEVQGRGRCGRVSTWRSAAR